MEYRSPLGYNFKLEQSLSASRDQKSEDSPSIDEHTSGSNNRSKKNFGSDNRRNSGGNRNSSYRSGWQRQSDQWKSPRNSQQDEPPSIEQFYHPSMLENPWEELERNLNVSNSNSEEDSKK